MKIKVYLLFLFPCFSLCNDDFCRETNSSLLYNRILVGYVIKTLLTRGIFSCAHECLSLSSCSSYNYETTAVQDGVCEINGSPGADEQQNLAEKYGFAFAKIQRGQVRVDICNVTIFQYSTVRNSNIYERWFDTPFSCYRSIEN